MGASASSDCCVEVSTCGKVTIAADSRFAQRLSAASSSSALETVPGSTSGARSTSDCVASRSTKGVDALRPLGKHVRPFDARQREKPRSTSSSASDCSTRSGDSLSSFETSSARGSLLSVARTGDVRGILQVLAAGEEVNCHDLRGQTPLMLAAGVSGDDGLMVLKELLDAGANVDDVDHQGWTALMHACRNDNLPATSMLIEHGASLTKKDANERTALILASLGSQSSFRTPSLVRFLLEEGCRLQEKDAQGWSAFFHACELGNLGLVRFLMQKRKIDLEERAPDGTTPLGLLKMQGIGRERVVVCDENGKRIRYSSYDLVMMDIDEARVAGKGKLRAVIQPTTSETSPTSSPRQSPTQSARRSPRQSPRSSPATSPRLARSSPSASPEGSPRAGNSTSSSRKVPSHQESSTGLEVSQDFVKGFRQAEAAGSEASSPRVGRRRRSKDIVTGGASGIPAAATCHPQKLTDCKAMVSVFVNKDGIENKAVYIAGGHTHLIQSEKDLYSHIASRGVDGV